MFLWVTFIFCSSFSAFGQERIDDYEETTGQFCYIDSVNTLTVYHTKCFVTEDKTYQYYEFQSEYSFTIKKENRKSLYNIVSNYEKHNKDLAKKITLGSYKCYSIVGRSTKEKVLHPGQYETTYVNNASITIQFIGSHLLLNFPKTEFIGFTAPTHTIYIPYTCIEQFLDALR